MAKLDDRRWWAIGALAFTGMVVGFDVTVLNIALPTLATQLHASNAGLQWVADSYNLVLAAMLLPAGLLADRFGRKRMVVGALLVFGAASAVCAYSDSVGVLVAARATLGLGGAFILPLSISIVRVLFNDEERPRAIAITTGVQGISFPLGPIVGGWLLNHFWWGSVFLINVPVCAVAVIAVLILLPESRDTNPRPVDVLGIVLSVAALVSVTYGFIEEGQQGWGSWATWTTIIAGLLIGAVFLWWEQRVADPLIDPKLFRSAAFGWGVLMTTVVGCIMFGVLFAIPQYFQAVSGTDAQGSGIRLLPVVGGLLIGAVLAAKVLGRLGPKIVPGVGFLLLAVAFGIAATGSTGTGYAITALWLTVSGLGMGVVFTASMDLALNALSAERSGIGSSLIQTVRQVGATIGVAILGTILSTGYQNRVDVSGLSGQAAVAVRKSVVSGAEVAGQLKSAPLLSSVQAAFVHGLNLMLVVCAVVAAIAAVLAVSFVPRRPDSQVPAPAGPAGDRVSAGSELA